MLAKLIRFKPSPPVEEGESVPEKAGLLFASGMNCTQAVLQSTTGIDDPKMMEMAEAFGGGIGDTKCLCGAVSGGVMALGLSGRKKKAGKLVELFKKRYGLTCCSALSRPYKWNSREHLANCRKITEDTAAMVEDLLNE
ncbi:MAG: C-GCAxxG-C-C family protein [Desulfuromonadales bacterium]